MPRRRGTRQHPPAIWSRPSEAQGTTPMTKISTRRSLLLFLLLSLVLSGDGIASGLYFIDAHSQVDHQVTNLDLIIEQMDGSGVYRTILAARSGRTDQEIAAFAQQHPDRIIPSIRTKSKHYNTNKPQYYKKLGKQLKSEQFGAMAELLMFHARKGNKAPEVAVYPDDRRILFALDGALRRGWPLVIHIEFKSLTGTKRQQFMQLMEGLLDSHPGHPFVLNHTGQLDAPAVTRLIGAHANIYFLTAHTNPVIARSSDQPWVNMFDGERLTPAWKALMIRYPGRFVFALDNVWKRHWKEFYGEQIRCWRAALADLPPDVAQAVAHRNAERLWHIPPRRAD